MKHSNPEQIDHKKENITEAFCGVPDGTKFIAHHMADIQATCIALKDEEEHNLSVSFFLTKLMDHPTLTDDQKLVIACEYGRLKGVNQGEAIVCGSCAVGPASKLLHSLNNSKRGFRELFDKE